MGAVALADQASEAATISVTQRSRWWVCAIVNSVSPRPGLRWAICAPRGRVPRWTSLKKHMTDLPPTHADSILVVDDDADSREMLVEYLQVKGFTVHESPDGATALDLADALRPLILVDLAPPELGGLETTRRLRADANIRDDATIIVVTARALATDREAAHRAGCNFFVLKPYDLHTLVLLSTA
jgi:two-component system cell cycle response regulator DivK